MVLAVSRHRSGRWSAVGAVRDRWRHPHHPVADLFAELPRQAGHRHLARAPCCCRWGSSVPTPTTSRAISTSRLRSSLASASSWERTCGAKLAQAISGATLQRMFAVFIVLMAIRLWLEAGKGCMTSALPIPDPAHLAAFSARRHHPRTHHLRGGRRLSPATGLDARSGGAPELGVWSATTPMRPGAPGCIGCCTTCPARRWSCPRRADPAGAPLRRPARPQRLGGHGYSGPCPPPGKPHRYFFRLYALDIMLTLPHGVYQSELEQAMADHILAQGDADGDMTQRQA